MTFTKPKNLKYVDLAIYIDEHIHTPGYDEAKCFEYMYHLFYILAVKGKMFLTASDYDSYALYGATQLFLRYKKEQKEGSTLVPIKSCLNYIKSVLYPLKINYQKANFGQVFREEAEDGTATGITEEVAKRVRKSTDALMVTEYRYYLTQLPSTIKAIIKESPYSSNPVLSHNLYVSCLLTILKSITMSNKNKEKLAGRVKKGRDVSDLVDKIYEEESQDDVVVFHLNKNMKNYIKLLTVRCKKEIAKDLRYIIGSHELSDSVIKDMLMQPLEELKNGRD